MKKVFYKVGAVFLSASIFFVSIFNAFCVSVFAFPWIPLIIWVAGQAGGYYLTEKIIKPISQDLGWTSADIQVDENGNVILSESQMQELKTAIEEYTHDANGKDKYGMYIYESDRGYTTVEAAMIAQTYNLSKEWNRNLLSSGTGHIWVRYVSSTAAGYATFAPNGAVWIAPSSGYAVTFYNQSGTGFVYTDDWYFTNNNHTWSVRSQMYTSCGAVSIYGGPGHVAFETIEGYREYLGDDSPYTLVPPTYTGGNLVIPKDQLVNPDNPTVSGNDFDDDGNPVTEKGWLQRIYERLGDILDQLKQIKWLTVGDVILNAIDTFGEGVGNVVGAVVDSVSAVFPLCIAWDFVFILNIFVADPVEPVFTIPLKYEPIGLDVTFTIDLTDWEWAVEMVRVFELLAFIAGLFNLTVAWVGKGDDV